MNQKIRQIEPRTNHLLTGMDVLRHRVAITFEAEAEEKTSETAIQKILMNCPCRDEK